ncbi:hypothetical protein DPMN_112935 [Dreissena polymorpha]|uniref:Uncharacterized protein n=1 Tax=Dreissena polymorpha TaxID=45954 RepID=A0A9D4QQC4_DREPO|nr:hypothetical protein DPMN_112935 [Dreissena polymorpha]
MEKCLTSKFGTSHEYRAGVNIKLVRLLSQVLFRHSALVRNIELGEYQASSDIAIQQKSRISSWGEY